MIRKVFPLFSGLFLFGISPIFSAAEKGAADAGKPEAAPVDHVSTVNAYLRAKLSGEAGEFYGDSVTLLPGHEYLKEKFGFSEGGDRSKAVTVTREQLVAADKAGGLAAPPEKVDELMGMLKMTGTAISKDGDFVVEGGDGAGIMKVPAKAGDAVVVAQVEGMNDVLVFLLRRDGDAWKLVAECID